MHKYKLDKKNVLIFFLSNIKHHLLYLLEYLNENLSQFWHKISDFHDLDF